MLEIVKTDVFDKWLSGLRDRRARAKILIRIDRLALGNSGDIKPIGRGLSEMRVDEGPGYRVYLLKRGDTLVVLLAGGNKATQDRDIKHAFMLASQWTI